MLPVRSCFASCASTIAHWRMVCAMSSLVYCRTRALAAGESGGAGVVSNIVRACVSAVERLIVYGCGGPVVYMALADRWVLYRNGGMQGEGASLRREAVLVCPRWAWRVIQALSGS